MWRSPLVYLSDLKMRLGSHRSVKRWKDDPTTVSFGSPCSPGVIVSLNCSGRGDVTVTSRVTLGLEGWSGSSFLVEDGTHGYLRLTSWT